jgi:hypothetical protein
LQNIFYYGDSDVCEEPLTFRPSAASGIILEVFQVVRNNIILGELYLGKGRVAQMLFYVDRGVEITASCSIGPDSTETMDLSRGWNVSTFTVGDWDNMRGEVWASNPKTKRV